MKFKKTGLMVITGLLVIGIVCGAGAAAHVDPNSFSKATLESTWLPNNLSDIIAEYSTKVIEVNDTNSYYSPNHTYSSDYQSDTRKYATDNLSDIIAEYSTKAVEVNDSQVATTKSTKEAIISGLLSQAITNNDKHLWSNDYTSYVINLIPETEKKAGTSDYTAQDLLARYTLAEVYANNSDYSAIIDTEENTKSQKLASALALVQAYDAPSNNSAVIDNNQITERKKNVPTSSIFKLAATDYVAEKLADTILSNYVTVNSKFTDSQIETLSLIKTGLKNAYFDKIEDDEAYLVHNTFSNEEFTSGLNNSITIPAIALTALAREENGLCMLL